MNKDEERKAMLEMIKDETAIDKNNSFAPISLALLYRIKYGMSGGPFELYDVNGVSTYLSIGVVQDFLDRIAFTRDAEFKGLPSLKRKLSASFSCCGLTEQASTTDNITIFTEMVEVLSYEVFAEIMMALFYDRSYRMVIRDLKICVVDDRLTVEIEYFKEPV